MDYSWEEKVFMFIALFLNPLLLHLIGNIATKDDEHSVSAEEGDKKTKKKKETVDNKTVGNIFPPMPWNF